MGAGQGGGGGAGAPASIETCEQAAEFPSSEGCEFWAVDLDQQDGLDDPASAPWGVTLTATSKSSTDITIDLKYQDQFTLQPGEVKDTWTQKDAIVEASTPVLVAQLLVSQGFVAGPPAGDPSLLVFPPVEQFATRYAAPMPVSWTSNFVVLAARPSTAILLDGKPLSGCTIASAGVLDGVTYEARRCKLPDGPTC